MRNEKSGMKLWERNAVSIKTIQIGIFAMRLLIPASMIESVIKERGWRNIEVTREVIGQWCVFAGRTERHRRMEGVAFQSRSACSPAARPGPG